MSLVSLAHAHLLLQLCFCADMLGDSRDCRRRASLRPAPVHQAWQVKARDVHGMRAAVAPLRAKGGGKAKAAEPEPEPEMEVRALYSIFSAAAWRLWWEIANYLSRVVCQHTATPAMS